LVHYFSKLVQNIYRVQRKVDKIPGLDKITGRSPENQFGKVFVGITFQAFHGSSPKKCYKHTNLSPKKCKNYGIHLQKNVGITNWFGQIARTNSAKYLLKKE
jgi:hypothetical protein